MGSLQIGASGKSCFLGQVSKDAFGVAEVKKGLIYNNMDGQSSTVFDTLARSTTNAAWGALAMEVLARLGVTTVVSSPGSRSTPLVYAAVRNPRLEVVPVLDERAAGFFALGIAKRTGRPTVLVCTSGSALANYAPAVAEAALSGTPLLILSADRSLEERDCGAGQTIDQVKFFGESVRHFAELLLPEALISSLRYLRQTLVHAVDRSTYGNPGPVHLNFPFREPLAPDTAPDAQSVFSTAELEAAATVVTRTLEAIPTGVGMDAVAVERLVSHERGIIVVGDYNAYEKGADFSQAVQALSAALGWPVLADVLNPLRAHTEDGAPSKCITHYEGILRKAEYAETLAPTAILQIGALPTSKTLRNWLRTVDAVTFLLADRPANLDPLHRVATILHGDVQTLATVLESQRTDPQWATLWNEAERTQVEGVDHALEACTELFGGKAPWLIARTVAPETAVFFANSMSVRFAEYFWSAQHSKNQLLGNRGVNGIDGNLATALGIAHGGQPTVLLIGDLAFLHDYSALLLAPILRGSLTIVLLNNDGGGVFEFLPIAQHEPPFENFFATPQSVGVQSLCDAHSVAYQNIDSWETFQTALQSTPNGVRLLELKTDRKVDREFVKSIFN